MYQINSRFDGTARTACGSHIWQQKLPRTGSGHLSSVRDQATSELRYILMQVMLD